MSTSPAAQANYPDSSLYAKLGGETAIKAVVDEFYERVLADSTVNRFFKAKQMPELKQRQVEFFTTALGGPALYQGRSMREAHQKLNITGEQFDAVAGHLKDALTALGVDEESTNEVIDIVAPLKEQIVK